jgi:hypothetical protein
MEDNGIYDTARSIASTTSNKIIATTDLFADGKLDEKMYRDIVYNNEDVANSRKALNKLLMQERELNIV